MRLFIFFLCFLTGTILCFKRLEQSEYKKEVSTECRVIGKLVIPSGSKSTGYPVMAFRTVLEGYEFDTQVSAVTYSKYNAGDPIWMYIEKGKLYPEQYKNEGTIVSIVTLLFIINLAGMVLSGIFWLFEHVFPIEI